MKMKERYLGEGNERRLNERKLFLIVEVFMHVDSIYKNKNKDRKLKGGSFGFHVLVLA